MGDILSQHFKGPDGATAPAVILGDHLADVQPMSPLVELRSAAAGYGPDGYPVTLSHQKHVAAPDPALHTLRREYLDSLGWSSSAFPRTLRGAGSVAVRGTMA